MKKSKAKVNNKKFMTFRVTPELHKMFKVYCAQHSVKGGDVLEEFINTLLMVDNGGKLSND